MPVVVIDTIKPKNNLTFPIVEDVDVLIKASSKRLSEVVATMATQADIEALQAAVNGKASQADLTALSQTVSGKASQADLTALSNIVEGKQDTLSSAQLTAVNSGITSELVTQIGTNTTAINGKANASDVTTEIANLQGQIDQIEISASAESVVAPEVAASRVTNSGAEYATLGQRLNNKDITDNIYRAIADNNLFYPDEYGYTQGYYYDTNNTKTEAASWGYTKGLIPVEASTKYKFTMTSATTIFVNFYNSSRGFISGTTTDNEVTTPSNASFIRISIPNSRFNGFKVSKGEYINIRTDVDAVKSEINNAKSNDNIVFTNLKARLDYKDKADDVVRSKIDNNIFYLDNYSYTEGYYYDQSNVKTAAGSWGYTSLIPAKPETRYVFTTDGMASCFCNYYNANKQFISSATPGTSATTPQSTAYIRLSVQINKINSFKLSEGTYVDKIQKSQKDVDVTESAVEDINSTISNNIYGIKSNGYVEGYYCDESGSLIANSTWSYINMLPVEANTRYTIRMKNSTTSIVDFYDSNRNFISGAQQTTEFTTTADTAFIRLSLPTSKFPTLKIAKGNYINYGETAYYRGAGIECGSGKQYTRLRDAVARGCELGATVIVYPGTYDLTEEFATELSTTLTAQTGIGLYNNVHVKFMSGAYVVAEFDGSDDSISTYFSPFYTIGSFTLENAHIVASNCRYCVHDEMSGAGTYSASYINCHMEQSSTRQSGIYMQAIGGGLGLHGNILIDGGYYKSSTEYGASNYGTYGTADNIQQPISYHNGYSENCDSKITIKNVYFANRGYLRLGNYGASTTKTPVEVSNCSFGLPIMEMYETGDSVNRNFNVVAFNNVSRNEEVPFEFSKLIDLYTNRDI